MYFQNMKIHYSEIKDTITFTLKEDHEISIVNSLGHLGMSPNILKLSLDGEEILKKELGHFGDQSMKLI